MLKIVFKNDFRISLYVCVSVGTAPFFSCRKHNCLQTSTVLITRTGAITDLCAFFFFRFLPLHWPRKWQCLASTSQRSIGVTTAVASARPSPPAHALRTAVDMKRRSGSVLGKNSNLYSVSLCILLVCMWIKIELMQPGSTILAMTLLMVFACSINFFKAGRRSCWRHLQCLCVTGEEVEEVTERFQEELESCKWCLITAARIIFVLLPCCSFKLTQCFLPDLTQVVDARAGPGFKVTKPKKIKNSDGKKKSKLKKLHKLKRQSKFTIVN